MKKAVMSWVVLAVVVVATGNIALAGEFVFQGNVDSSTYVWRLTPGDGKEYVWAPVGYLGYSYALPDTMTAFILDPRAVCGTWPWDKEPIGWKPASSAQIRILEGAIFLRVAVCKEGGWPKKCLMETKVASYKIVATTPD